MSSNLPSNDYANEIISDPVDDILTEGLLHKIMVAFSQLDKYPVLLILILLFFSGLTGLLWQSLAPTVSQLAAITLFLFTIGDTLLFWLLPKQKISFGPWASQTAVLATARFFATLPLIVTLPFFPPITNLILFIILQLIGTALLMWGTVIAVHHLQLTHLTITSDRLPNTTAPIRILHISDLHIERPTKREAKVLQLAQDANPDLILISGDYVNLSYNTDPETHAHVRRFLQQLSAPHGIYAVLGSPPVDLRDQVVPIFDGLDHIHLMRHAWQKVMLDNGRSLVILGMDCTHHLDIDAARLAQLVAQAPVDAPQAFVFHSPEMMPQATKHELDLYLCGHTHGGQVRVPLVGPILTSSQLGRRYVMGHYHEGRTHLYNSRGVGLEGLSAPRIRFLCPPEMTLITIKPA